MILPSSSPPLKAHKKNSYPEMKETTKVMRTYYSCRSSKLKFMESVSNLVLDTYLQNSTHSSEEILLHAVKKRRSASTGDIKNAVKLHSEEEDDHPSLEEETFPVDVDEEEEYERYSRRGFSHGYHLVKGQMGHGMEDYIVADTKTVKGHKLGLYAIFDGHSGRNVSDCLQNHLFDNILNQPEFWRNPKNAIKRAYESTDDYILHNVVGSRGGSTAVTAIVIDGKKLVVANVGDSRAILCSRESDVVKQITVDHEPCRKQKRLHLQKARPISCSSKKKKQSSYIIVIICLGNVSRVDVQLAMTRAFGDKSKSIGDCESVNR